MAATPGKRRISLPALPQLARVPSPLAALIVGAICGALVVGLVFSGERGCDAVSGSSSCGGVGMLMLTVILVGAYALGVLLLRMFGVDEPGLTAFFGIMLPLVVVLAFLTDQVFSSSMVLILPALAACSFAVGSVFTTALENSDDGPGRNRPQAQPDIPASDAAEEQAPPELPRYAPEPEQAGEDNATQPLAVGARSAQDETTMLTAAEERQTAGPESTQSQLESESAPEPSSTLPEPAPPESTPPEPTPPEPTDAPAGEPDQTQAEPAASAPSRPRNDDAEPADPDARNPEPESGAADRDEVDGDDDRPSPWRRA